MTLTVLRMAGQIFWRRCLSWGVLHVFLIIRLCFWVLETMIMEVKYYYSPNISRAFTINLTTWQLTIDLDHLAEVMFVRFPRSKFTLSPSSSSSFFFFFVCLFLAMPGGVWDFSSLIRDRIPCTLIWKLGLLTTGLPENSLACFLPFWGGIFKMWSLDLKVLMRIYCVNSNWGSCTK